VLLSGGLAEKIVPSIARRRSQAKQASNLFGQAGVEVGMVQPVLIRLMRRFPEDGPFERAMQVAELDYIGIVRVSWLSGKGGASRLG
jgi:hypothetical protein